MSNQWFLDQARLGNMYHAHSTGAGAVTVIHATYTGLVLSNPLGSGKDLVVDKMNFVGTTLAAIAGIGVMVSPTLLTAIQTGTAGVIHNGRVSGSNSNVGKGQALVGATLLTTPVWLRPMGLDNITAAITGYKGFEADFGGSLVIPPGMYAGLATLTTARTGLASITWAEVDAT